MSALHAAYGTVRYWRSSASVSAENARQVDLARLRSELSRRCGDLDALLAAVERNGIAVVASYWSPEQCAQGRAEIDRLLTEHPQAVHLSSGGSDKRLFGVEQASSLLATFHHDPFLRGFGELIGGLELYNFVTLGARIDATPQNNGSGDGWHRDAHGFQFKSILYLSDVSEDNGPLEYLRGSHGAWRAALDTVLGGLPPPPSSRYEPAMVERVARSDPARAQRFIGRSGTLLLVNTAGVHRGRPLVGGTRYALTNYYYHPFQVDEGRIEQFAPLVPGTAERVRRDLSTARQPGLRQ